MIAQAQARHQKLLIKMMMTKNDDSDSKSDSKGDSTDVNDYIDKNAKLDWNESKFKKLKVGKDSAKSI